MKTSVAAVVGLVAIGTSAQTYSSASTLSHAATTSAPVMETTTEYFNDCTEYPSGSSEITVTDQTTKTYCPECTGMTGASGLGATPPTYTTTYETVYSIFCPTGQTATTYTVTESCSSTGVTRPSSYIPQDFTVTTSVCTMCPGPGPVTATLTVPKASTSATALTATDTSPSQPAGASVVASSASALPAAPAPPSAAAAASSSPMSKYVPAATGSSSPAPAAPVDTSNSTAPITPFEGGATSMSMGISTLVGVMGMVGLVAFAL